MDAAYFERLYERDPDPWNFATSPYEQGKYRETLAILGDRHFSRALEVGCSIGILTSLLAERCDELLAVDINGRALAAARDRCAANNNVRFERRAIPLASSRAARSISSYSRRLAITGRTPTFSRVRTGSRRWRVAERSSWSTFCRESPTMCAAGMPCTTHSSPTLAFRARPVRDLNAIESTSCGCYDAPKHRRTANRSGLRTDRGDPGEGRTGVHRARAKSTRNSALTQRRAV